MDRVLQFVGGAFALLLGIALLLYMIKETTKGYRSKYGNDIGLYFGAVFSILLGIVLLYRML